ncbi:hypothetical protein ACFOHQ_16085 [Xanthomonas fragariae]
MSSRACALLRQCREGTTTAYQATTAATAASMAFSMIRARGARLPPGMHALLLVAHRGSSNSNGVRTPSSDV